MTHLQDPTVSVIIPTYNRKALLMRAVESALQQTCQDIEILVMDDGSTDGTEKMFSSVQNPRVHYYRLPHKGACAARNAGMDYAKGTYIAFLDSDDTWRSDKLEVQQHQLEASGADVVFSAFVRHDGQEDTVYPPSNVPEGRITYKQLLGGNLVSTQTIFGRTECMKKVRFDTQFPRMQDWEFAIRVAKDYKLYYYKDTLAELYVQPDSISRHPELGLQAMRLLMHKYRRELESSLPNTLLLLGAVRNFAMQCAKGCAFDYLKAISPRRSCKDNFTLLFWGTATWAWLCLKRITKRSKSQQ